MNTDDFIKKTALAIAEMELRRSLIEAGRESEETANKLLKQFGRRCHIHLTIKYEDIPEGEQTTEEPESVRVYTEMKEDV